MVKLSRKENIRVLVLAVVFAALFCGTFVKSIRSTIFYLLKHLKFKQMLILAAVMLFLCGSFNGLPLPLFLLLGAIQYIIILATIVLLWWFFFKRWNDSIDSCKYQKFTDKAEQEYQEYKSKKAQIRERKGGEFSDLVNKWYHEFVNKEQIMLTMTKKKLRCCLNRTAWKSTS